MDERKPLSFPKTQLAVIAYDKGSAARSKLWEKVYTKRTLREAMTAHLQAMSLVRDAFWEDTKELHGLERSSFDTLNIETARFWAAWRPRTTNA